MRIIRGDVVTVAASGDYGKPRPAVVRLRRVPFPRWLWRRGAISMNWRPSRLSMPPQLGTVVGSPNPDG